MTTYRMSLISTGSISLDSTFEVGATEAQGIERKQEDRGKIIRRNKLEVKRKVRRREEGRRRKQERRKNKEEVGLLK
jgi:hypothetical protein